MGRSPYSKKETGIYFLRNWETSSTPMWDDCAKIDEWCYIRTQIFRIYRIYFWPFQSCLSASQSFNWFPQESKYTAQSFRSGILPLRACSSFSLNPDPRSTPSKSGHPSLIQHSIRLFAGLRFCAWCRGTKSGKPGRTCIDRMPLCSPLQI